MGGDQRNYRGGTEEARWAIELSFKAPVLFRGEASQFWRIPSDTIFRAIVAAAINLYGEDIMHPLTEDQRLRISSLILLKNGKPYIPHCERSVYIPIRGEEYVDASEITGTRFMLRIPRLEEFESIPFEYNVLNVHLHRWLVIGTSSEDCLEIIKSSLRLLGEIGIGSKRSRGLGRFDIVKVTSPERYNLDISNSGLLTSRYLPAEEKEIEGEEIYYDTFSVDFGGERLSLTVVGEGSRISKADEGRLEYAVDSKGRGVPILLRPLFISTSQL